MLNWLRINPFPPLLRGLQSWPTTTCDTPCVPTGPPLSSPFHWSAVLPLEPHHTPAVWGTQSKQQSWGCTAGFALGARFNSKSHKGSPVLLLWELLVLRAHEYSTAKTRGGNCWLAKSVMSSLLIFFLTLEIPNWLIFKKLLASVINLLSPNLGATVSGLQKVRDSVSGEAGHSEGCPKSPGNLLT